MAYSVSVWGHFLLRRTEGRGLILIVQIADQRTLRRSLLHCHSTLRCGSRGKKDRENHSFQFHSNAPFTLKRPAWGANGTVSFKVLSLREKHSQMEDDYSRYPVYNIIILILGRRPKYAATEAGPQQRLGRPDQLPARLRMDLFLHSVTDSLFNGPVINVNIFEDPGLLGKNDPVNARIYDYPFAKQAGKRS